MMDTELLSSILSAYKKLRLEFHKLRNEIRRMYSNTKKSIKQEIREVRMNIRGTTRKSRRVKGEKRCMRGRNNDKIDNRVRRKSVAMKNVNVGERMKGKGASEKERIVGDGMKGRSAGEKERMVPTVNIVEEIHKMDDKNVDGAGATGNSVNEGLERKKQVYEDMTSSNALKGRSRRGNKCTTNIEKEKNTTNENTNTLGPFMKMLQEETE